jgi:hypothetical protein
MMVHRMLMGTKMISLFATKEERKAPGQSDSRLFTRRIYALNPATKTAEELLELLRSF